MKFWIILVLFITIAIVESQKTTTPSKAAASPNGQSSTTAPPKAQPKGVNPPKGQANAAAPPKGKENATPAPKAQQNAATTPKAQQNAVTPSKAQPNGANPPKGQANAAVPPKGQENAGSPPKGKNNDIRSTTTTTANPQSKKITRPPAKAASNLLESCKCENDYGMDGFDETKIEGKWYEVAMQAVMPMNPFTGDCTEVTISSSGSKNNYKAKTSSKFSVSTITSNNALIYNGQAVYTWKLNSMTLTTTYYQANGTKKVDVVNVAVNSTLKVVVIDTDYKNYTILYICGQYTVGLPITNTPPKEKSPSYSSKAATLPPHMFILLSRDKKTTADFDMPGITKIIQKKYACFHNMNDPSAQDNETCKAA